MWDQFISILISKDKEKFLKRVSILQFQRYFRIKRNSLFKEKKKKERVLWQVEKYIFKMFGLAILPFPNAPPSRFSSDEVVSRKCGFFSCQFPALFGRSPSLDLSVWDIALRPVWKQLTLSFLYSKSLPLHELDKINWSARGIFCFASWSGNTCEMMGSFSVTSGSSPTPFFFLLQHCWGTGINDLTSKGRSIWTRHSLSQPGAAGSLVYPKYKAPGILETGRGSKTELTGHSD